MQTVHSKYRSIATILLTVLVLLCLSACEMIEDVMFPNREIQSGNLVILDGSLSDQIEFVSDSLDSIIVKSVIPNLNINSVILSTSGYGFLRRVESILPQNNNRALLLTRPVSFVEVFSDAEVNSQIDLQPETILFLASGCEITPAQSEIEISLTDFILADKDNNTLTTDDQSSVTGKIAFSSSPQLQWKTKGGKLQSVSFTFPAQTSAALQFNSAFGLDASSSVIEKSLVEFASAPEILNESKHPVTSYAAVRVYLQAEGKISSGMNAHISRSGDINGNIKYEKSLTLTANELDTEHELNSFSMKGLGALTLNLIIEINFNVFSVPAAFSRLKSSSTFNADLAKEGTGVFQSTSLDMADTASASLITMSFEQRIANPDTIAIPKTLSIAGDKTLLVHETGTFTDLRDGNIYATTRIGTQWWFGENLKYLPSVSPPSAYAVTSPRYYVYNYSGTDPASAKASPNYQISGVLYNSSAAANACPRGWHLPNEEEFIMLATYISLDNGYQQNISKQEWMNVGTHLKSQTGWEIPPQAGTDDYDFTAIPSGAMDYRFGFTGIELFANFWTSTPYYFNPESNIMVYQLYSQGHWLGSQPYSRADAVCIRCIKD